MTRIPLADFARKVLIMRQAQKHFDRTGYWSDQSVARREEAKVDELVAKTLARQKSLEF